MVPARARIVMKKKTSDLTIGPRIRISTGLLGSTCDSESSCRPVRINCTTTTIRIAVVTLKKLRRLMRMVPRTKATPNRIASVSADDNARRIENALGIQPDGSQQQDRLHAFAEDHQKDEQENTPASLSGRPGVLCPVATEFQFRL